MRLINQSYEICNQTDFSISSIYKHIEKCTRVAYKSEDKITENSAASFINKLIIMKHLAPMEFGTIHFKIPLTFLIQTSLYIRVTFQQPFLLVPW